MAIGKLDERSDEDIVAEINITPLTDIFLVLLIIFMITSSALMESGAKVNLPKVSKTETTSRNVVVTLTTKHEIYINQIKVTEERFKDELKRAFAGSNDKSVILEGDKDALLGDTVKILSTAKEAGAEHISIAAQSEEKPQ